MFAKPSKKVTAEPSDEGFVVLEVNANTVS